jgi:hypothetical protein
MLRLKDPLTIFIDAIKLGLKIEWLIVVQLWEIILQLEEQRSGFIIALFMTMLGIGGTLSCIATFILYFKTGIGDFWKAIMLMPVFFIILASVGYWLLRKENPIFKQVLRLFATIRKSLANRITQFARTYGYLQPKNNSSKKE